MANPKAFYSYMENEEKLNMLSDEQAGRLYKSLYAYSRTGEKPDLSDDPLLAYAFMDFIIDIDRDREKYEQTCQRRSEAGRKGGQAKATNEQAKEANAKTDVANQANAYFASNEQAKTSKSSETEIEIEVEVNKKKENIKKEKYGVFKNVLLTADELQKLKASYPDYLDRIERLSEYIEASGKKYKSHYATILSWARKDQSKPNKRGSVYSVASANFDVAKYENSDLFGDSS